MNLSANFSLKELTKSDTATRLGIDNTPDEETIDNLKTLCEKSAATCVSLYNEALQTLKVKP